MSRTATIFSLLGVGALCFLTVNANAQVSPKVPATTKNHNQQVIGYLTQWDAWKADNNGVAKGSYNHLNVDYSQYTILNFSFFGVAVDGSLHSGDFRDKNIYQSGVNQKPDSLINKDIYSSFDLPILKGETKDYYTIDTYLQGLGYKADGTGNGWENTTTGAKGKFPLTESVQNGGRGLFDIAKEKGVKVMASIGGWSMCKHYKDVAADPAKRAKFTHDCKRLIAMGFDGIDIDWEYPGRDGMNFKGTAVDFANHLQLMKDIRAAIGADKLLTGCFAPVVKDNEFDWKALENVMDYFNMMTYDYYGGWSDIAGHNSPLYDYPGAEFTGLSLDNTAKALRAKGVNMSKVNLGAGFYGRGVITERPAELNGKTVKRAETVQPDGPITTCADFTNFAKDVWDGTPNYSWIVNKCADWTEKWDGAALVPYKTKGNFFLSYDNARSVGCKADYIKTNRIAGVIIWQVYGDMMTMTGNQTKGKLVYCPGTTSPLVNEINAVFGGKDVKSLCQSSSVSVKEIKDAVSFEAYPNPVSAQVHIYINNSDGKNEVRVYNTVGQLVFNQLVSTDLAHVDLSAYNKGIYFISVTNSNGVATAKIVKE